MQRFVSDLHYPPPEGSRPKYPISAIYHDTPPLPMGPAVLPGQYTVKLTVGGRTSTQPLTVKMDPRVKTPPAGLAQQFLIALRSYEGIGKAQEALQQIRKAREQVKQLQDRAEKKEGKLTDALTALDGKAAALEGEGGGRGRRGGDGSGGSAAASKPTLTRLSGQLLRLLMLVETADATPTTQTVTASTEVQRDLAALLGRSEEQRPEGAERPASPSRPGGDHDSSIPYYIVR
jgi:hypothetical protein